MIYLSLGLALVMLVLVVCLVLYVRHARKKQKCLCDKLQQSQEKIDALYKENLLLRYQGKEYAVPANYEAKLLDTPPVLELVHKIYRPVVRIEGGPDNWSLKLVGADIYVRDCIGDNDGGLVVERCVNHISAEAYDDFWIQLREGFTD